MEIKSSEKRETNTHIKKILLVKTHAIGDLLMVTPSISAIRKSFPTATIKLFTGNSSAPIVQNNPDIDEIINVDESIFFRRKIASLLRILAHLRKEKFDLALIFQQSTLIHAFVKFAKVKSIYGLSRGGFNPFLDFKVHWEPNSTRYVAENFMDLAEKVGAKREEIELKLFLTKEELEWAYKMLKIMDLLNGKFLVGICPGGGKNPRDEVSAKRWQEERYADLAKFLVQKLEYSVILLGGPMDAEILARVQNKSGLPLPMLGAKLTIRMLSSLISFCNLVITNDSSPVHISLALKVPVVALFGPSNSQALLPPTGLYRAIKSKAPCSPCYANEPFPTCKNPYCMDLISLDEVKLVVQEFIKEIEKVKDTAPKAQEGENEV